MICKSHKAIVAILSDESVFDSIRDDGISSKEQVPALAQYMMTHSLCLSPREGVLFMVSPVNFITGEWHSAVVLYARPGILRDAVNTMRWVFENTQYEKIISYVPSFNRGARALCRAGKMTHEGTCCRSFKIHGEIFDQELYGMTKEQFFDHHGRALPCQFSQG